MKKFVLGLIPAMAAAAIIGSGYATWSFGGSGNVSNSSATVTTTDVNNTGSYGTLSVASNALVMTLDQGTVSGVSAATDGISFSGDISLTLDTDTASTNSSMISGQTYTYTFSLTVAPNSPLSTYVSTITYSGTIASVEATSSSADQTIKINGSDFSASYVEGKKPTTQKAYNEMLTALYGNTHDETNTKGESSNTNSLISVTVSWSAAAKAAN